MFEFWNEYKAEILAVTEFVATCIAIGAIIVTGLYAMFTGVWF